MPADDRNRLTDSRRVPGPSLWNDGPAVLLDLHTSDPERAVHAWHDALDALLAVCPVPGLGRRCVRVYERGATVGFEAPGSVLYDAVDLNEFAAEVALRLRSPGDAQERAARLAPTVARAFDAPLEALVAGARTRGLNVLVGEDTVTVGSGRFARSFAPDALPASLDGLDVQDVPFALVTGTNGKTTTTRLLRRMLDLAGLHAGHTSTEGVYVGDERVVDGDFAGPEGARRVLRQPVDVAVLETSRGGVLRRGLTVRAARVAVVTNVGADHFGEYGIETVEDVAAAKLLVAKGLAPGAPLVVNADDPVLWPAARALSARTGVPLAPFSLREANESDDVRTAFAGSGLAAFVDDGRITAWIGDEKWDVGAVAELPLAFGGTAHYNVQNALAALLAALALGVPVEAAEEALRTFGASPGDNPGRMNVYPYRGATVVVDYGHNDTGVAATVPVLNAMPATRRCVLVSQAGDRSDADNLRMAGQVMRLAPDQLVVTELPGYERGRAVGETTESLLRAFEACGVDRDSVGTYDRPGTGAAALLDEARPGDLVVLFLHDDRDEVLGMLREG